MKICQIVGYKNVGKTTVMEQLIRYFTDENWQVGSLKHHGHGGEIELTKGTDSNEHFEAGTRISGAQGETITQLTFHNLEFDQLIQLYASFRLDLLLVEGYKQATFPKIVLIKGSEELSLLDELSNIIAVGSWEQSILQNMPYPTFTINNLESFLPELTKYIINRRC